MTRLLIATLPAVAILGLAAFFLTSPVLAAPCAGTVGVASFYCCKHHGGATASGEIFNQNAMTAAMPNRRHIGERYRVTSGGHSVTVRINDTGGFAKYGRAIDLSKAAFAKLAPTSRGTIKVCLERLK